MKKVAFLDYCLPDYFSGFGGPVCAIPVYGPMTHGEVADAINEEVNSCWDYITNDGETQSLWDEYINELKHPDCIDEIFFDQPEFGIKDNEDPAYAYFAVGEAKTVSGLNFFEP